MTTQQLAPMIDFEPADRLGQRVLFTPGPVTTSRAVRMAAAQDVGSWDADTTDAVRDCQRRLLEVCGGRDDFAVTLLPGSGTYAVECVVTSAVHPQNGKLVILNNGLYGQRLCDIAAQAGIPFSQITGEERLAHDPQRLDDLLASEPSITHIALCHCETTSGVIHDLNAIGEVAKKHNVRMIVDAMATFCGYEVGPGKAIDFDNAPIDHIVASANKCAQGVPGLSYIISRQSAMDAIDWPAPSMSLDLKAQWKLMRDTGRFRYTPPTHVLLAFQQALHELGEEGGVATRAERYRNNQRLTIERLGAIGITPYIDDDNRGHINTTFNYPSDDFDFDRFKAALRERGYIIFPQRVTRAETFRIGAIGHIGPAEVVGLTNAIAEVLGRGPID